MRLARRLDGLVSCSVGQINVFIVCVWRGWVGWTRSLFSGYSEMYMHIIIVSKIIVSTVTLPNDVRTRVGLGSPHQDKTTMRDITEQRGGDMR